MKKIIILLACGLAVLCGCGKSNTDSSKIEALSEKLDLVLQNQTIAISNQAVIFDQVQAVKTKVIQYGELDYYYYTNQVGSQLFYADMLISTIASDEQKSVDAINSQIFRIAQMNTIMILTNNDVTDMESGVEQIKFKLGIH